MDLFLTYGGKSVSWNNKLTSYVYEHVYIGQEVKNKHDRQLGMGTEDGS